MFNSVVFFEDYCKTKLILSPYSCCVMGNSLTDDDLLNILSFHYTNSFPSSETLEEARKNGFLTSFLNFESVHGALKTYDKEEEENINRT